MLIFLYTNPMLYAHWLIFFAVNVSPLSIDILIRLWTVWPLKSYVTDKGLNTQCEVMYYSAVALSLTRTCKLDSRSTSRVCNMRWQWQMHQYTRISTCFASDIRTEVSSTHNQCQHTNSNTSVSALLPHEWGNERDESESKRQPAPWITRVAVPDDKPTTTERRGMY